MKKKVLSIALCLCMALTLLPTAALAVATYNVQVAGIQVTSDNKDAITGDGISGTVTYDPHTNTLTLNNATITNTSFFVNGYDQKISIAIRCANGDLKIKVIGSNTVRGACTENNLISYGIYVGDTTSIDGGGSLAVEAGDCLRSTAISSGNNGLTINNVELTAIGGNSSERSIGIESFGSITIENSKVIAKGGNITNPPYPGGDSSYGIEVANGNTMTINSGTLITSGGTASTSKAVCFAWGWNCNGVSSVDLTRYTEEKAILVGDDKDSAVAWDSSTGLDSYQYVSIAPTITAAEYATDAESGTDYVVDDSVSPHTLHIKTAKGAAFWSANGNSYLDYAIYLDNDIDVSDFRWSPVGTFTGTFDGQGHSISGLNVKVTAHASDVAAAGLFGKTEGAAIKNTGLIDAAVVAAAEPHGESYAPSKAYSGAFAAEATNCTLTNCFVTGSVAASGGAFSYAGSLVANSYQSTFTNCYSAASVMCTNAAYINYAGGLIGYLNSGSLENIGLTNCYSTGIVQASSGSGSNNIGGLSGYCINNPLLTNCFYLAASAPKGIGAYYNLTATGCGTFDSSGKLTASTADQFGTGQTLESYANTLLNALGGWVKAQASADYYTWAADNTTTPANNGYPVFRPAWVAQAQWGVATGKNNDQTPAAGTWVNSGSLTDAMTYANALASGTAYIQLLTDVDISATLEFAVGKNTVLDLDGKTIDGEDIPARNFDYNILTVSGSLTLCDSSTAAVAEQGGITNGHGDGDGTGGGVYVGSSGTFIMTGGNITGNIATTGGGVANEGTFTMTGGSIDGNTATSGSGGPGMGGGVANLGSFNMSGGCITDNTADSGGTGGGIANFGTLTLSGSVNISGNTVGTAGDNVALIYGTALSITAPSKLNISDALTNKIPIGVSIQEVTVDNEDDDAFIFTHKAGVFTSGGDNRGYISKFASDDSGFAVIADGVQFKLAAAQAITKADAASGSFTVRVNGSEVTSAVQGATVTVTPTADANYELDAITVTKTGNPTTTVTVTNGSFTMPDYSVTVTVSFRAVTVPSNPGSGSDSPSVYPITEGAEGEWTQGTDGTLRFRSAGPFGSFRSVSVDSSAIRQNVDYTTEEGSTYVTLKPEYLSTLTPGVHTMRVTFTGGYSVTTFTVGAKAAWVNPFADVSEADWFFEDVRYVHEKRLMQGTGDTSFSPHTDTSRGMIVTILWRMEQQPTEATPMTFTDVPESKYYYAAVEWAAENKIVEGYDALTFGPDDPISRQQMAAILYRYAKYKGYDVTSTADLSKFADADKIGTWATTAASWANANELITGKDGGILDPQGSAERCQVAAILHRFCNTFPE